MSNSVELTIEQAVFDGILSAAAAAGSQECMGLLASGTGKGSRITGACQLPAQVSGSHAEADPLAIRRAGELFRKRRQRPVGLWHSHGSHGVFHSAVDDHTVMRLLPAMAEWNFERPRAVWPVPAVTGPDTAVVPLDDGRWLRLALVGPSIPGTDDGHEQASWACFDVARKPRKGSPRAIHKGGSIRLVAGGVELHLGVPDGANVISAIEDHAPLRSARLFSLVVNRRGERYAEVVSVHDLGGELHVAKRACGVAVITDRAASREESRMLGLAAWADSLYLDSTRISRRGDSGPCREAVS